MTPAKSCPVTGTRLGSCPVARGPKGLPLIGEGPTYFRDPAAYTLKMQQHHGPMVAVSLPRPYVQVTEPEAVDHILRRNPDNFRRGKLYERFSEFMGRGLLTLDDDQWRPHRLIVQPAFAPARIRDNAAEAVPATEAMLRRWADHARTGAVIDIAEELMTVSTRTMGKALVGRDLSTPDLRYPAAAAAALRAISTTNAFGVGERMYGALPTRYGKDKRFAHRVLNGVARGAMAAQRRAGEFGTDPVGRLLASDLDDQSIVDDLRTLLLAGTDTTGQILTWTLYELARHPAVRAEVEDEVDRVLCGRPPTAQQRDELVVTRSAIEEALRLYPAVWQFPRDLREDDELAGRALPGGTSVLLSPYGTHRNPEHWSDPHAFNPARFRDGAGKDRHRSAYFPFGGGRRQCIGKNLAMAVLTTAVAMVTQRFRITLAGAPAVRPGTYLTIFPVHGVHATVRERT